MLKANADDMKFKNWEKQKQGGPELLNVMKTFCKNHFLVRMWIILTPLHSDITFLSIWQVRMDQLDFKFPNKDCLT